MQKQIVYPNSQPYWVYIPFTFLDLQVAALTNAVPALSMPARGLIHDAKIIIDTPFVGTTTLTLSLGIGGVLAKFVPVSSASAVAAFASILTTSDLESLTTSTDIILNAIATVSNLSNLSAGAGSIQMLVSKLG